MSEATRRMSLGLFVVSYLAFGLIFSGVGNGNTVPRIAMTLAMVERGSLYIDDFAPFTDDKGSARGHYISDKAPGMSLLAVPAVGVGVKVLQWLKPDARWIEVDPASGHSELTAELHWVQWIGTLSTSALLSALAVVVFFRTALLLGVSEKGSLFAAMIYGFATPTWGWATTFFSHAPCGAFLAFGLGAIIAATTQSDAGVEWTKLRSWGAGVGSGFLLGMAILLELTSAPAVLCIALYGVWRSSRMTPLRTVPMTAGAVLGGLIAGVPFLLHNFALFDNPFSVGYSHSIAPPGYESIAFTVPSLTVAAQLLFGGGRGLLWLSPILLLAPLSWLAMWRAGARSTVLLCLAVFLAFLLVNAAYVNWYAGATTGPRYVAPALAFLALPFGWLWDSSRTAARRVIGSVAITSAVLCFAMASVQMFAPWDYERNRSRDDNVVIDTLLPQLARQDLPNLVVRQLGATRRTAFLSYAVLVGGGLLLLWLSAGASLIPAGNARTTRPA